MADEPAPRRLPRSLTRWLTATTHLDLPHLMGPPPEPVPINASKAEYHAYLDAHAVRREIFVQLMIILSQRAVRRAHGRRP